MSTDTSASTPSAAGDSRAADTGRLVLPPAPPHLQTKLDGGAAIAWSAPVSIRTYPPEDPSRYPMFLEHRVYQGSSGRVYPLPLIERIRPVPEPREWQAIHLENRYVRLMVLPELGGRIHVGYDKTTGYDFFYRNNVIKPALVGLAGPWISGGVEFNWPQHHRPATFLPVQTLIEHDTDGSVVVWCSDHDPFTRMQGTHGIRLHPDRSVVQVDVRLHNRTSLTQSFLWWANAAVRVHEDYQSFFPEDVTYVADHARRALTRFPAADRTYYGVDYPARAAARPGADRIDFYRNIPVPTSYMVVDSAQDFFGGFDHAAGAGLVHWADRRIAPGKKQWTWGDAAFGHAWDDHLTDDDGPYIELMAGVYTDNQPDFSWLAPGETKRFSQYWYPVGAIGVVHQATPDAAVHVDRDGVLVARFAVTSPRSGVRGIIRGADGSVREEVVADLSPGEVLIVRSEARWTEGTTVELCAAGGDTLVAWESVAGADQEPWTAEEPPPPAAIDSVDELYLTGLHLQQYRHPTRSPLMYWNDALTRDPGDVRVRLALAEAAYRAADYDTAHGHASIAVARATRRNTRPRDAQAFYLLGLIESRRGHPVEAAAAWASAMWDAAFVGPAGLELVRQAAREGRDAAALADLRDIDRAAAHDRRRPVLFVVLLRRLDRGEEAGRVLDRALDDDPLNPALRYLRDGTLPVDGRTMIDVAVELSQAGENDLALSVLESAASSTPTAAGGIAPIARYVAALLLEREGRTTDAALERRRARAAGVDGVFPAGLDDHDALAAAVDADGDAVAAGLLGMLLYDAGRRRDALAAWQRAVAGGSDHAVVYRNAGLASYTIAHDDDTAVQLYERALQLSPGDSRLLFERDQLAAHTGETPAQRLERLEAVLPRVMERDDLVVQFADLLIAVGRASEALALLEGRSFQPWEGGEGTVLSAWDRARAALGLGLGDPPRTLGEARSPFAAPIARHETGEVDYFATSLPELLLFVREEESDLTTPTTRATAHGSPSD